MDLQVPVWPFFLVSWIGDVSAVLLIAIRTYRLIFHPDLMHDPKIKTAEGAREQRGRAPDRLRQPLRADAAARTRGHGDGPRWHHRLRLPHRPRARAET